MIYGEGEYKYPSKEELFKAKIGFAFLVFMVTVIIASIWLRKYFGY
jgi:hypothetical protein